MEIKVLGPGCAKCDETKKVMEEACAAAGVADAIEKITDFRQIAACGVFSTPAVVIDGKVKCIGRVPARDEAVAWLRTA